MTLSINVKTRRVTLQARRKLLRTATFKLDGKRVRAAKKTPLQVTLSKAKLKRGKHTLKVLVKPRRGKTRTITLRLTVGCQP